MKKNKRLAPIVSYVNKGYARGIPVPWMLKMWLKIGFSCLRFSYGFWIKLGIFRHGDLSRDLPALQENFQNHLTFYRERYGSVPEHCLELGPGDSVGHALSAKAEGIKGVWFVDVGDFATKDQQHYQDFYKYLRSLEQRFSFDPELAAFDRESILNFSGSQYGTEGLKSFAAVPDNHIELSYSHAVLEHIGRDDFGVYMKELYRTHKSDSSSRHWVDLHDHLGGALNSFRFSPKFWESKAVRQAGFYTNRLTMTEMVKFAEDAGFSVEIQSINKWTTLPTPLKAMHASFKDKTEEELNICTFLMVMDKITDERHRINQQ